MKLKLHAAKAGGISWFSFAVSASVKLKLHAAKAGGIPPVLFCRER